MEEKIIVRERKSILFFLGIIFLIYIAFNLALAGLAVWQGDKSNWKGCTLTEIYYAGDDSSKDHQDWADRNNADEAIVLLSSFDVDSSGGDGSLNPNSTYDDWNWILVRTNGGQWQHVDHGYLNNCIRKMGGTMPCGFGGLCLYVICYILLQ